MSVVVYLIESPDTPEVVRTGAAHPVLGGLIDLGTSARLVGEESVDLRAEVAGACRALAPDVEVVERSGPLEPGLRDELEPRVEVEPLFAVLFAPAGDALVVTGGPALPSMGPLPPCDLERFRASLLTAVGKPQEDSLFTEQRFGFDLDEEERLRERLRQLYGE